MEPALPVWPLGLLYLSDANTAFLAFFEAAHGVLNAMRHL
jgi:hypothetical protein